MSAKTIATTLLIALVLIISSSVTGITPQSKPVKMNGIRPNASVPTTLADPDGSTGTQGIAVDVASSPQSNPQPLDRDIWTPEFYYEVGAESGSLYLVGFGFDGEYFYCPEFNSANIHKFDIDGNYLGSFSVGVTGILDLAYDGEYFYGATQYASTTIYVMDFTNEELVDTITAPAAAWNIAYDPDADSGNGGFWIGQWSYHIYQIDMEGNQIDEIPVPESCFGFAYDNTFEHEDPQYEGPFLWIFTGTSTGQDGIIKCIDINSKELVAGLEHNVAEEYEAGIAGGLELTYDWDTSKSVLIGLVQGTVDDYAFGYEISLLVPPEHDVGVKQILAPQDGPASADMIPEVLVKNYGNHSEYTDVQFEVIKCEPGPPLLYENFSGSFPPAGWTTDYWEQYSSNNAGGEPPEARCYKYTQYYAGDYYHNYIMSPPVDCTGFEKVNVKFHFAIDVYYDNYVYIYLKYRQNSTSPWKDMSPWDNPIPADILATWYEIGCYGWGKPIGDEFQIMFEMTSYYYYFNYVYLDDVTIEGCAGCAEYADLVEDEYIPKDEEVEVEFAPWTPSEWHNPDFQNTWEEYPVTTYTILQDYEDENSRNNQKQMLLNLWYPWLHDIGTLSLEGPEDGPAQTFPIEATIKNVGQYDECCFKAYAQVAEIDYGSQTQLLYEDFYPYYTFPPAGWTRTNTKWRGYSGNYCGGGGQEAQFYYSPSETGVFRLYTPPIDTSDYGAVEIKWLNYLNHFSGPYTIKVETSPDGVSWSTVWEVVNPSSMPAEAKSVVTGENVGSGTFYVSWTFDGYSWNTNWWNIDNVEILGFPLAEPEYTDEICIADIEQGQEMYLEFNDWTPLYLAEEKTGTITYACKVWTDMTSPEDNNHANDAYGQFIELEFFHDVGVQVLSPIDDRANDQIWDNGDTDGSNGYSILNSPRRSLLDDFGLTKSAQLKEFRAYILFTSSHATDCVLKFWSDDDGDPGEELVTATSISYSEEATGRVWFGYPEYEIFYEFEPIKLPAGTYWVELWFGSGIPNSFWMIHGAPLWGSECWINYDDYGFMPGSQQFGVQADLSYQLWGSSGAQVYVPLGNQDIKALAQNLGTFPEYDMTCYADIYEYYTNCSVPTQVYEDMIEGIDVTEPLEGTETLTFEDYNFAVEGPYELQLELVDDSDEKDYGNNQVSWAIGCDAKPPATTHELNPPTPDGENDWYVSDVEVTVTAADPTIGCDMDGSGVKEIRYQIDGGAEQTIPGEYGTFTITTDSTMHDIKYWAIDNVGNAESKHTINFKQDQTPPEILLSWKTEKAGSWWNIIFTATATDATADMWKVEFYLNDVLQETITGSGPEYVWTTTYVPGGKITYKSTAYDLAGNNAYDEVDNGVITPTPTLIPVSNPSQKSNSMPMRTPLQK